MQLSEHFTLEEMIRPQTAAGRGIDNTPSPEVIANLEALCLNLLARVRLHFAAPVLVSSGYRCPELNVAVGGSRTRQYSKARQVTSVSWGTETSTYSSGCGRI
ncbi:hypothetical protein GCM10011494_07780 [Novosphingobium endophyticum]|uniref:Peptidase M15A C-terminal domain-containing protein n=1 Tax=Novosphingobium endophyticum TaxID=1955250 RepID=A0A916X4B4_9SPHN|nr:D-Ala-D-Ala carboxypeptidase family metallohydrolase [Novosphingobium endophyticum]GGB91858.1 hypothetical protein GCM10011494_07780 [Novosphingobium endophyticum]